EVLFLFKEAAHLVHGRDHGLGDQGQRLPSGLNGSLRGGVRLLGIAAENCFVKFPGLGHPAFLKTSIHRSTVVSCVRANSTRARTFSCGVSRTSSHPAATIH